ncbi:MAG: hypothetical protein SPL40_02225 [Erysipelotrichaceae bacterium]|nr:hypothetical protein [Erysipelotrichaceae bacterium]
MNYGIIIALASLDLILGTLLYVTIRQIQIINQATQGIDKMACEAAAKADRNSHRIEDCYKAFQLTHRDAGEAYSLAAECRNELTRLHMNGRNDAWKEKLKPSRQPSEESKG